MDGSIDYLWVFDRDGPKCLASKWKGKSGPGQPEWVDATGASISTDRHGDGSPVSAIGENGMVAIYTRFDLGDAA